MEICPKEICTGCLACFNTCSHTAIELHKDDEGFIYPEINVDVCVDCGLCKSVCPIIDGTQNIMHKPIATYAAWNKDKKVVRNSSSGGLFTTIAEWVLSQDGVVYGAAFDENMQVEHIRIEKRTDLVKLRGSKYVQSYIGDNYKFAKKDLKQGKWVLFSGTPCQIAGLKKLINEMDCERLLTIDIVCHGVPSPIMFEEYKKSLERKYQSKMVYYSFRDKQWSWNHFNTKALFENKKEYLGTWEEDIFMRGFLREYFLRPACHTCNFAKIDRCGDFTLADFWGYRGKSGEKIDDDRGVSMVLVNTQKASTILRSVHARLQMYPRCLEDAVSGNQALRGAFKKSPYREEFWQDYREHGYDALVEKYCYPEKISRALKRLYRYGRFIDSIYKFLQKWKQKMFN